MSLCVVAILRRLLIFSKIFYCVTLHPIASCLLMLVIFSSFKIYLFLMSEDKTYVGTITLGATTSTQDKEGDILIEKEVPALSEEQIRGAFDQYMGDFEQIPPMVSAIKKDGVPLYKLARQGQEVKRDPRPVFIKRYDLSRIELTEIDFSVDCSKGFNVRS